MFRYFLCTITLGCCVALISAENRYGGDEAPANWRGIHQRGVFPAHGLVTSCSEQQNVVWKTTLPNFGCGSPVYAAGKVFVICDPGGDPEGKDFLEAPVLVCCDVNTGKILWQQPVDNLDARPPVEAKEAKALREAELRDSARARGWMYRYKRASAEEKPKVLRQAREAHAVVSVREKAGKQEINWAIKPGDVKGHKASKDPAIQERAKRLQRLRKNGWFIYEGWYYPGSIFTGQTMPSPVCDASSVYAFTNQDAVACFDWTGKRR